MQNHQDTDRNSLNGSIPDLKDVPIYYKDTDRNRLYPSMPDLEDMQDIMDSRVDIFLDPLTLDQ